jgi:hypothetical protein
MELMVNRDVFTEDSSLGQLFIDDEFECYTLEDKFREVEGELPEVWKVKGETAIPLGRYEVQLLLSPRFGFVTPHLLNVPGFSEIEMHPGNTDKDTEGCILVGTQRDADSLSNSRIAFGALMEKLSSTTEAIFITVA